MERRRGRIRAFPETACAGDDDRQAGGVRLSARHMIADSPDRASDSTGSWPRDGRETGRPKAVEDDVTRSARGEVIANPFPSHPESKPTAFHQPGGRSVIALMTGLVITAVIVWRLVHLETDPVLRYLDALVLVVIVLATTVVAWAAGRFGRKATEARALGSYHLLRRIGGGGMGEVYLAEHRFLKRPCAVKLIRPESAGDPRARARFEREVRMTATLSHPNTVEVYDYGRAPNGAYYYVMEYLPGLTLEDLVDRYGALPPGRVVYLLRQVCLALREAHGIGLIHRDLKPSNVIAAHRGGADDVAKLLDFGLVRHLTKPLATGLTADGLAVGTPLYMSPEQAAGDLRVDERSDIYSLGAVAYYLLTGRPPFERASATAVLAAHARDPVVPPSLVLPGIPEDLERVVLRCLAKSPADRFSDTERLERALGRCACEGDWDADHAARWWREFSPTAGP
ncbi:serine/threonine protein kinase [bacterium]|nr:serine/threonine protein kinase [bacterium]